MREFSEMVARGLTPELLRRWFGEAMLQQAVHISDLGRASVVDLIRVLDYPNDYAPVLTRHAAPEAGLHPRCCITRDDVGKTNSSIRLARHTTPTEYTS